MQYYSQAGQDKWVHEVIGNSGVFVEVGAYDGVQTSNTFALENSGWTGLCIEANREIFKQLHSNRKSTNVNKAVTNYKGTCLFGIDRIGGETIVDCDTLDGILKEHLMPRRIDYMSLDIEGHELTALKEFPFEKWDIRLLTVEHNIYCEGAANKNALYKLLTSNGYVRMFEDVRCLDPNPLYFNQPFEDWYVKNPAFKP